MQDYFSKWMEARPLPNKAAVTVVDATFNCWFPTHGPPAQLHSDQGAEFTADVTKELCERFRVDKTVTTANRPQSNGLVERGNRSIQAILKSYVNSNRNDWDDLLPAAVCAYCSTPHASTGISPYRMMYGREISMPIDMQLDVGMNHGRYACRTEYVEWLQTTMHQTHEVVRNALGMAAKRQKKNYRESCQTLKFQRGDWVWRAYPKLQPGKLRPKNTGPWLVLGRQDETGYKIQ